MKRKTKVLLITTSSALVLVLMGFAVKYAALTAEYRAAERHAQLHAVSELAESLSRMSDTLVKGVYATSPELMAAVSAEIWNHSAAAIAAAANLPLSDISLEKTESFITRTGDYAYYLARRAASQTDLTEAEREGLVMLSETAETLSQDILSLESEIYAGNLSFAQNTGEELSDALQTLSDMESEFPESTLTDYDGAMSGHMSRQDALLTAHETEIPPETAKEKAANALQLQQDQLSEPGTSDGLIPAYTFSGTDGEYAAISRQGGHLISMRRNEGEEDGFVSVGEAPHTAQEYLQSMGYEGLRQIYYHMDGDTASFRFAYQDEEGILYYPDLITVGVSTTDGSVVHLDAEDYILYHHDREPEIPSHGYADAVKTISSALDAKYAGLAVIHTPGRQERLCHEFLCTTENGQRILIYYDAKTGQQCKLSMIHEDENGVFLT